MQGTVGRKDMWGGEMERRTEKVGHDASGFPNHEASGCGIPGHQFQFPEAVKSAGSNIGQVQRGRTCASDRLNFPGHFCKIVDVVILVFPNVVGKACGQETVRKDGDPGNRKLVTI
jgi:hypothetical protein